jgi:hypothetical protein
VIVCHRCRVLRQQHALAAQRVRWVAQLMVLDAVPLLDLDLTRLALIALIILLLHHSLEWPVPKCALQDVQDALEGRVYLELVPIKISAPGQLEQQEPAETEPLCARARVGYHQHNPLQRWIREHIAKEDVTEQAAQPTLPHVLM